MSTSSIAPPAPRSGARFAFLDLLRGWALLVMIEVHVFNTFLLPSIRDEAWFSVLNYVNGLVAPSFIFISGFVFMIAAERKMDSYRAYGTAFWRQLGRIGTIWVVGYFLHLPFFSLHRMMTETTPDGWLKFYQADVLHTIALGLLLLFALRLAVRRDRVYTTILIVAGIVFAFGAMVVWDVDMTQYLPAPVAAYVNATHFSLFPVFPWLAFMMAGGYLSNLFQRARTAGTEEAFFRLFVRVGLAMAVGGFLLRQLPVSVPWVSHDVRANPIFFFERLGVVMTLLWLCRWYTLRRNTERSVVLDVSRESLMVYAAHLLVIYGQFFDGHSLAFLLGKYHGVIACMAGTLLLAGVMIGAAMGWGWLKRERLRVARLVMATGSLIVCVLFVIR